jgi:hypothetical protein
MDTGAYRQSNDIILGLFGLLCELSLIFKLVLYYSSHFGYTAESIATDLYIVLLIY